MNILIVSHCNFKGNSAFHAFSMARELFRRGFRASVCVPDSPETVWSHGLPGFPVLSFDEAMYYGVVYPDDRGPDVIYAFTPREHVRTFTEQQARRYAAPYVVHLEDNEEAILRDDLPAGLSWEEFQELPVPVQDAMVGRWRTHPTRGSRFLAGAAGATVLMDRLLEFVPEQVPHAMFWPGFEDGFLDCATDAQECRYELGVGESDVLIPYTGNVHNSNVAEFRSLVLAVALVRRRGVPVRLLKTGWNHADMAWLEQCGAGDFLADLGFIARSDVPRLLGACDILVQPGVPGPFNDYRFPSKLPEYLATGKPVVLPKTNIGRFLEDGKEAIILSEGSAQEIADKIGQLLGDRKLRDRIGAGGRAFAARELRWDKAVDTVLPLFDRVCRRRKGQPLPAPPPCVEEPPVKLLAFYLPQFHPIPENDVWWGKGFTEWTNVTRALPNFAGHFQPQLPADLGFYDLRVEEVLAEQARLARAYGIYGFCFYYYWFGGRRVLETPIEQFLRSGSPKIPFCLCWANENWTRKWDGSEHDILLEQKYEEGWAARFIRDILPALSDPRCIRIDGAPLLLVYRVDLIPGVQQVVETWRDIARREAGLELHLSAVQSFGFSDPRPFGFDAAVEFPPHTQRFLLDYSAAKGVSSEFSGYLEDYIAVKDSMLDKPLPPHVWYRGVMPSWDNTARRGRKAHILINSSPAEYEDWLEHIVYQTLWRAPAQEPLVFINAWNEWAEGTHLEPDQRYGHAWLEATRRALAQGIKRYGGARGQNLEYEAVSGWLTGALELPPAGSTPLDDVPHRDETEQKVSFTSSLFTNDALRSVAKRYRSYRVQDISYATVRDFVDSWENLRPLATAQGDLKDAQRPWVLKAILGNVRPGGRLVEIGGGEPFVADILARLGFEVWIVDPYDGSGNGPQEFERFQRESPRVHFVRALFSDKLLPLPRDSVDCIYSISVLEHVSHEGLASVFRGMRKYLRPEGWSIHAVDHVHRGRGAPEHLEKLRYMTKGFGLPVEKLDGVLTGVSDDPETYYLSAESHNRWRGNLPYDEFPMRTCVSIQLVSRARAMRESS